MFKTKKIKKKLSWELVFDLFIFLKIFGFLITFLRQEIRS